MCCGSWGHKEDTGTRLSDWTELKANPCNSHYLKYFIIASFNPSSKTLFFLTAFKSNLALGYKCLKVSKLASESVCLKKRYHLSLNDQDQRCLNDVLQHGR